MARFGFYDALPHELYAGLLEELIRQRIHAFVDQFGESFDEDVPAHKRDMLIQAIERIGSRGSSL